MRDIHVAFGRDLIVFGSSSTRIIDTERGQFSVDESGDLRGIAVFLLHGMPGSRLGPRPRPAALYRLGVRLICYDRPGYGWSTRQPGRRVADAAADVEAIANHLRVSDFAVVGRSAGGPHALACAALLPARVLCAAALVSVAPPDAVALDWYDGMSASNIGVYSSTVDVATFAERLRLRADRVKREPESMLERLRAEMTVHDRRAVNDFGLRRLLSATYGEAFRQGAAGWIDDVFALTSAWGFDLNTIEAPVRLWHGEDDNFAPARHTRWLGQRIPTAEVLIQPGAAHFAAMEILVKTLGWLVTSKDGGRSLR